MACWRPLVFSIGPWDVSCRSEIRSWPEWRPALNSGCRSWQIRNIWIGWWRGQRRLWRWSRYRMARTFVRALCRRNHLEDDKWTSCSLRDLFESNQGLGFELLKGIIFVLLLILSNVFLYVFLIFHSSNFEKDWKNILIKDLSKF